MLGRRYEASQSVWGGARAPSGFGPVVGRPRCARIRGTATGPVTVSTSRRPPQRSQRKTSTRNTRRSNHAQGTPSCAFLDCRHPWLLSPYRATTNIVAALGWAVIGTFRGIRGRSFPLTAQPDRVFRAKARARGTKMGPERRRGAAQQCGQPRVIIMVAGARFELTTFGL